MLVGVFIELGCILEGFEEGLGVREFRVRQEHGVVFLKHEVDEIAGVTHVNLGMIDGNGTGKGKDSLAKLFGNFVFANFNFQDRRLEQLFVWPCF